MITSNEGVRGGKVIPLKKTVDEAVEKCPNVKRVFVARRTDANVPMKSGRDIPLDEVGNLHIPGLTVTQRRYVSVRFLMSSLQYAIRCL